MGTGTASKAICAVKGKVIRECIGTNSKAGTGGSCKTSKFTSDGRGIGRKAISLGTGTARKATCDNMEVGTIIKRAKVNPILYYTLCKKSH